MKSSMSSSLILFASILLTSSLLYLTEADLISNICSRVTDPKSCEKGLRSDPRSRTQDLIVLGQISIDQSAAATSAATAAAKSVQTADNKASIDLCLEVFDDAIDDIKSCTDFLKSRDVGSFRSYSASASTYVSDCEDGFGAKAIPQKLSLAISYAQNSIQVLESVGVALAKSN